MPEKKKNDTKVVETLEKHKQDGDALLCLDGSLNKMVQAKFDNSVVGSEVPGFENDEIEKFDEEVEEVEEQTKFSKEGISVDLSDNEEADEEVPLEEFDSCDDSEEDALEELDLSGDSEEEDALEELDLSGDSEEDALEELGLSGDDEEEIAKEEDLFFPELGKGETGTAPEEDFELTKVNVEEELVDQIISEAEEEEEVEFSSIMCSLDTDAVAEGEEFDESDKSSDEFETVEEADKTDKIECDVVSDKGVQEEEQDATPKMNVTYNESELVRLQSTIRLLREEREKNLAEVEQGKTDKRALDQENLSLKAELDETKIEMSIIKRRYEEEVFEFKHRFDLGDSKREIMEEKLKKSQEELLSLGGAVRIDLRKVKQREKELENQLELVQMDTVSQVQGRDNKILELKRKIDSLEFNMENTAIREHRAKEDNRKLKEKLQKIMKTLRGSIHVLEEDLEIEENLIHKPKDV
ncbi:MAG: hypothetical protein KAQ98_12115 [Bacteriovoracaceae bacterium]|nr:hypothetical protein [Bacteriovoracaceae bacterium]